MGCIIVYFQKRGYNICSGGLKAAATNVTVFINGVHFCGIPV
jgi:hypothetical protein